MDLGKPGNNQNNASTNLAKHASSGCCFFPAFLSSCCFLNLKDEEGEMALVLWKGGTES